MKTVLVTGATGFIGSHLIPVLHQQGWQITATVRNNSRKLPSIPMKSINVGEIDGNTDWNQSLKRINSVIHLGGRAHILKEQVPDPEVEFLRVNTEGTANLVQQAIQAGVKHFIFISSIGAMATLSDQILRENLPPHPDTPYGRSKLKAEQALINLAGQSKMTWTILRPPLVYGAGNPGNMASLVKLIKKGLPLPFGLVNNCRSFLYVGNLVDALTICLSHPNAKNKTFLISDGHDLSTPQIIDKIAHHLQRSVPMLPIPPYFLKLAGNLGSSIELLLKRPLFLNRPSIDRLLGSLVVDSSYIRHSLHWKPPYTLDQGLALTF